MKILKTDQSLNMFARYREQSDATSARVRKSSNMIYLISLLSVTVLLGLYINQALIHQNLMREIEDYERYVVEPENVAKYNENQRLMKIINETQNYNVASATFMEQLSKVKRFGSKDIEYYQTALDTAAEGTIRTYSFYDDELTLQCVSESPASPKKFAQYLEELKNVDGEPLLPDVKYIGFQEAMAEGGVSYTIKIKLWETVLTPQTPAV